MRSKIMDMECEGDDEGVYTAEFRASLRRSAQDVKKKRLHSLEEVEAILGARR